MLLPGRLVPFDLKEARILKFQIIVFEIIHSWSGALASFIDTKPYFNSSPDAQSLFIDSMSH